MKAPPQNGSARWQAGAGTTSGLVGHHQCNPGQGLKQFPENLRASGLVADAAHVEAVLHMAARMPNSDASALLRTWRDNIGRFPYAVAAGQLHRDGGGVIGGFAGTWKQALALFSLAQLRFCEIAETQGDDFSSAWLMALDAEHTREIRELIALSQPVGGRA